MGDALGVILNVVAWLFRVAGMIVFAVAGVWGTILCFKIIWDFFGAFIILAFLLAPFVFSFVPFYAGFALGDWSLLILNYGGFLAFMVLWGVGNLISAVGNSISPEYRNR